MTSMWKDFQKTFLSEAPRGMESRDWKKSSKWAIELNLLSKGKKKISPPFEDGSFLLSGPSCVHHKCSVSFT